MKEVQTAIFKTSGKPASLKMSATHHYGFAKYCNQNRYWQRVTRRLRLLWISLWEQEIFDDVELTENLQDSWYNLNQQRQHAKEPVKSWTRASERR